MLSVSSSGHLGDARSDLVNLLASFMGRDKAEAWMKSLETLIKKKAEEGATKGVKPLVIGALAVGGAAALLATVAIVRSRR